MFIQINRNAHVPTAYQMNAPDKRRCRSIELRDDGDGIHNWYTVDWKWVSTLLK